jgi:hypothetical protein
VLNKHAIIRGAIIHQFTKLISERIVTFSAVFRLHVIAYNLIRLGNLLRPTMEVA